MGINVPRRGHTELDDPRHTWVIDSARRDVRGDEHRAATGADVAPERSRYPRTVRHRALRVHLVHDCLFCAFEGQRSRGVFQQLSKELHHLGGVEEEDDFGFLAFFRGDELVVCDEPQDVREDVGA